MGLERALERRLRLVAHRLDHGAGGDGRLLEFVGGEEVAAVDHCGLILSGENLLPKRQYGFEIESGSYGFVLSFPR